MPFVSNQIISHLKAKFRRENLFADSDQYVKRKELNLSIVHFLQKKIIAEKINISHCTEISFKD